MSSLFRIDRRFFLRGTAGAALALPLLPSLLPSKLEAQALAPKKRFITFATQHGGIYPEIMFPSASTITEKKDLGYISSHQIGRGALVANTSGANTVISPQLTAPTSQLSAALVDKMNVIRGLDIPYYIGHHSGGFLGNFARSDADDADSTYTVAGRPTIDQLMVRSSSFYSESELRGVKAPSVHIGWGGARSMSWNYKNPANPSMGVQYVDTINQSNALFSTVYSPPADPGATQRTPAVDRVYENYKRLRDSGKLSTADRDRLNAHMERINELQRKLVVISSCTDVSQPSQNVDLNQLYGSSDPNRMILYYQVMTDVLLTAIVCGTRIGTVWIPDNFSNYAGDWHQDVAHQAAGDASKEQLMVEANQRFLQKVLLPFVNKLDVPEADGKTFLDNSLVMWVQESGFNTHDAFSMPVVTFGSMGGYFNTGSFVDYTNYANKHAASTGLLAQRRPGILYAQWLGTLLQGAGLPPSEYQRSGETGYGDPRRDNYFGFGGPQTWPDALFQRGSEVVPFLVA